LVLSSEEKKGLAGKPAPEIALASSLNTTGKPSLAGLKGKVVLLEFWATWCGPCRASIPHLQKLHDTYGKKGLVVLSVTSEDLETVKEFVADNKMTFPIGIDDSDRTMTIYAIRSIPAAFLIDTAGRIVWQGHTMELKEHQIEAALKAVRA
jgi:thiol-disulfide isomerase/thioredoxin